MRARTVLAMAVLAGCTPGARMAVEDAAGFNVQLVNAQGEPVGTLRVTPHDDGSFLALSMARLPPGVHGVHLHAVGRCDTPDFTTAGPHLNPNGRQHGSRNPQGPHLGDLPNMTVGADGGGTLTAVVHAYLAANSPLLDADGTAIVVHAAADDLATDPSGSSGARIACGVIHPR
ncbi:MAG TPA: superoxide dismutase family protein [Longimicrobiaceae bacterium]|nr:superoxide dismutase family protein [Longimicrobiaceae bacterium]